MIRLGVSLYPEQESLQDIDRYLAMCSKCGFHLVFTSMFSVEGTREEIIDYFKQFTAIAHKYGMKVSGDCNSEFFETVGASATDLSVFKEMGIDIIRMDLLFRDQRDVALINNSEGIDIELSIAFTELIEYAVQNGADPSRISTCHNFYPLKYSAPSLEAVSKVNDYWREKGIDVAFFISSQEKGTHGPWPLSDGLPTIEEHRNLPLTVQLKHCIALKNISEVRIGNAYASDQELMEIKDVIARAFITLPRMESLGIFADYIPHGQLTRIPFKVRLEEGITPIEKKVMMEYPCHCDMGDCLNYSLRSRFTRVLCKDVSIPERPCHKTHFTRGDVVIVNDNVPRYRGELNIVLKDMEVDGQRNLVGRIVDEELMILDCLGANDIFTFMEHV